MATFGYGASKDGWRYFVPEEARWWAQSQGFALHFELSVNEGEIHLPVLLDAVTPLEETGPNVTPALQLHQFAATDSENENVAPPVSSRSRRRTFTDEDAS